MRVGIGIFMCSLVIAGAALTGCATGGGTGDYRSFMQICTANAKTENERSECAWENASRMAGGGR